MKLFAIADLHLGFSTGKWMDRFGDHWKDHHERVEAAWRDEIRDEDLVFLPGDFSWAMRAEEVALEFEWLAKLPGRKVLVKGNHDYWWPKSRKKLQAMLPEGIYAIKKNALVIDDVPIVGVRGGDFIPNGDHSQEQVDANLAREESELARSIEDLERSYSGSAAPIALFHYPPFPMGARKSRFTRRLDDIGCSWCLFGHLHNESEWNQVFQGESEGIRYKLVSCDSLGFRPFRLDTDDTAP